ncbi:hypothetical protein C8J57DRAFT_1333101 [Mycena rebaudengoi]|nr:hypothetical protein C8J57DRAFT_1333101 [Mycena rebaudengoi]
MSQPTNTSSPSSRTSTPPPDNNTDVLRELANQLTPSQSQGFLRGLRHRILDGISDQDEVVNGLKRRAVDAENEVQNPTKRTRTSRNHRTDGAQDLPTGCTGPELAARIRRYGRKFVILCGIWLALGEDDVQAFFSTSFDEDYDPELRFNGAIDESGERQAQLREVVDILPEDLVEYTDREWFARSFDDGMRNQLNNTTSRLRRDGLYNIIHGLKIDPPERSDDDEDEAPFEDRVPIKVTVSMLATPELRSQYFKVLIGWRADTSEYSIYGVPLLHGNESDTLDFNELFRHRLLLKVFASIIRGTRGPVGLMKKKSKLPRAECMQRTFSIGFTTPGAITSCAILVPLRRSARVTGINYYERHKLYLQKILDGLRLQHRWARDLFLFWDSHLFPELKGSHFGGGVSREEERQREEIDDATAAMMEMPVVSDAEDVPEGDDHGAGSAEGSGEGEAEAEGDAEGSDNTAGDVAGNP